MTHHSAVFTWIYNSDLQYFNLIFPASDASSNEEVEFLKQTVQDLSRQIASLQTELNTARLQEFEAQEANVALTQVKSKK